MSNVSQHRAPIDDFTHEGWRWAITKGTEEGRYTLWRFIEPQGGYQGTFYADEAYAEDNEVLSLDNIHNLGQLTIISYENGSWISILNSKDRIIGEFKLDWRSWRNRDGKIETMIGI